MDDVLLFSQRLIDAWLSIPADAMAAVVLILCFPALLVAVYSRSIHGIVVAGALFASTLANLASDQVSISLMTMGLLWLSSGFFLAQRSNAHRDAKIEHYLSNSNRQQSIFLDQIDQRSQLIDAQIAARALVTRALADQPVPSMSKDESANLVRSRGGE